VVQKLILVLWFAFLAWLLYFFIKKGMKNTGLSKAQLIHNNTEDLQTYIDNEAVKNNGFVNGTNVKAPANVPEEYYVKNKENRMEEVL
jgi:hypothetical protein